MLRTDRIIEFYLFALKLHSLFTWDCFVDESTGWDRGRDGFGIKTSPAKGFDFVDSTSSSSMFV